MINSIIFIRYFSREIKKEFIAQQKNLILKNFNNTKLKTSRIWIIVHIYSQFDHMYV